MWYQVTKSPPASRIAPTALSNRPMGWVIIREDLLWGACGDDVRAPTGSTASGRENFEVGPCHQADELLEAGPRAPPELALRLAVVADQVVDLGRTQVPLVDAHVAPPVGDPGLVERDLHALLHRVRLVRGDHVVLGVVLLKHQPHRFDVVLCVPPVP